MIPLLVGVGTLLVTQAVLAPVVTSWFIAHIGRTATWGLGLWGLALSLLER